MWQTQESIYCKNLGYRNLFEISPIFSRISPKQSCGAVYFHFEFQMINEKKISKMFSPHLHNTL